MEHRTWNRRGQREDRAQSARSSKFLHDIHHPFYAILKQGVSLVEVVIGTAILLLAVTGIFTAYNVFIRVGTTTLGTLQATYLLEEGVEAMTTIRDYGWSANIVSLSPGVNYYLSWSGGRWVTTATVATIDNKYSRYINIENVVRDSNDSIASSGSADPGTKKLNVYVSWQNGATTTTRSLSSYLMNVFNN